MPWGGIQGDLVSVSEREVDGLELVGMPARPRPPFDAFIDLRELPDGPAVTTSSRVIAPAAVVDAPPADARGFLRHYPQLAAGGDGVCAGLAALAFFMARLFFQGVLV